MKARILLVDDNPTVREAIAIVIDGEADMAVCGEAFGVSDGREACERLLPDLVLVDISLKGEDGLDLVRWLTEDHPPIRTVVLSLHDESRYMEDARQAGAEGYAIKSQGPDELLACIRRVLSGHSSFARPVLP